MTVKKLDDFFDKSTTADYMPAIRKLLDEAKSDSIEIVNLQLNKFREVNQMGKCHSQTSFSDLFFYAVLINNLHHRSEY